jgi:hypothetical protein
MVNYPSGSAATHRFQFNTRTSAGAPITLAGSPTLALHKAGDSANSPLATSVTLSVDYDSITGRHDASLSLSGLADGYYSVVVSAGTVNSQSIVGEIVDTLTVGVDSGALNYARIGAPVGSNISADIAAVQADTDNLQTRIPAALVSGKIDATVSGAVGSVTGAVGSVAGNVGGNVVGSVASVTGNVGGSVASVTGSVGSVTGSVGGSVVVRGERDRQRRRERGGLRRQRHGRRRAHLVRSGTAWPTRCSTARTGSRWGSRRGRRTG